MHKEAQEELDVRFKLLVLELAQDLSVTKICQEYSVPRASFYRWKQKYEKAGRAGLFRKKPIAYHHPHRTAPDVVEKILVLRTEPTGCPTDHVLLGALPRDQDLRSHREQSAKSPWVEPVTQKCSETCSTHQAVCENGSRTPRTGGCEVFTAEKPAGKDR